MGHVSGENQERFAFRLEPDLRARLREAASMQSVSESDIVREALQRHLPPLSTEKQESAYDVFSKLGLLIFDKTAPRLPADLSVNKAHMEGFGENAGKDTD